MLSLLSDTRESWKELSAPTLRTPAIIPYVYTVDPIPPDDAGTGKSDAEPDSLLDPSQQSDGNHPADPVVIDLQSARPEP